MPEQLTVAGVPNLYRVTPCIYRSAQPTREGLENLANLGWVKNVLNLRLLHADPGVAGINKHWVRCEALFFTRERLSTCLDIITAPENQPILVHCLHGADRTGVVIAAYRMQVQGWHVDDAIHEMTRGPYGFHHIYPNLVNLLQDFAYNL